MTIKHFRVDMIHRGKDRNICEIHFEDEEQNVIINNLSEEDIFQVTEVLSNFCYNRIEVKGKIFLTLNIIKELFKLWIPLSLKKKS